MKVLIVKTSSLGDILHAFPAVRLLVDSTPEVTIDWLVKPAFREMVEYCPNLNRIIEFDGKTFGNPFRMAPYAWKLIRELRREKYDLVIDLQGLFRSAVFAGFSGGKRIAGFARPREFPAGWFYRERVSVPFRHALVRNCDLVRGVLNLPDSMVEIVAPKVNERLRAKALALLDGVDAGHLIALVPGARWESKCFPPSLFVEVAEKVAKKLPQTSFVILGGPAEKSVAKAMTDEAGKNLKLIDLTGKTTIGEMAELLRLCRMVLCNDSGPMHIAAAMGVPLCALFGPTDPEKTGPYAPDALIFRKEGLDCLACLKRCCPKGGNQPCFYLDAEKIAAEILNKLENKK